MLLVNDDQSERGELRRFREERVGTNEKGGAPVCNCRANVATFWSSDASDK
jgi:hypothetical protein